MDERSFNVGKKRLLATYAVLGLVLMLFASRFDYARLRPLAPVLVLLGCLACDEDGLSGPLPGGETPCDPEIDVDGGADATMFAEDHVVAAGDLTRLADGTFTAQSVNDEGAESLQPLEKFGAPGRT